MPPETSELPDTPRQRREKMKCIVPLFFSFSFLFITHRVQLVSIFCGIFKVIKSTEFFCLGKHFEVVQEAGLTCTIMCLEVPFEYVEVNLELERQSVVGKKARVFGKLAALWRKTRIVEDVFQRGSQERQYQRSVVSVPKLYTEQTIVSG